MYGWVWHKLPGGWALKTLESLAIAAVISAVLIVVVFPWVEPKLPFSGNTVDGQSGTAVQPTSTPTSAPAASSPSSTDVPQPTSTAPDVLPGD